MAFVTVGEIAMLVASSRILSSNYALPFFAFSDMRRVRTQVSRTVPRLATSVATRFVLKRPRSTLRYAQSRRDRDDVRSSLRPLTRVLRDQSDGCS